MESCLYFILKAWGVLRDFWREECQLELGREATQEKRPLVKGRKELIQS